MSSISKQLIINNLNLPTGVLDIVKDYIFPKIRKIPETDERYNMLQTIPGSGYYTSNDSICMYLRISAEKDYFLVYDNFKICIQTFRYSDDDRVHFVEGHVVLR